MRKAIVFIVLSLFSLVGCAAATDAPESADKITPRDLPPSSGGDVPRHPLAGEQSPGESFGAMPSWPVDPDMCATPRFVRDGRNVTDSQTGQVWGSVEALAPTAGGLHLNPGDVGYIDPVAFANGMCNAQFSGSRAATAAELAALRGVVAGCPLPGAFFGVDLWHVMTSDDKCIDLKTGAEVPGATCPAVPFDTETTPAYPTDVSRAALCVK